MLRKMNEREEMRRVRESRLYSREETHGTSAADPLTELFSFVK